MAPATNGCLACGLVLSSRKRTWRSPGCGSLRRPSGNIDCARSSTDTYYRFHETGIVYTTAGGQSLSAQTRRTCCRQSPPARWCSICGSPHQGLGVVSKAQISCRRSLRLSDQRRRTAKTRRLITWSPESRIAHVIEPSIQWRFLNDY